MDARITKTRLSNLLSYDWLRILLAIVVAVFALCVFFPMVQTRAKDVQTFTVYAYFDLSSGGDLNDIEDDLLNKNVFSYEILETHAEQLTELSGGIFGNLYAGATYTTRLMNSARTVMFVSALDDSESSGYSAVKNLIGVNPKAEDGMKNGFLDIEEYLADCEQYLRSFFGENWREGTLDEEKAEQCFLTRNNKDKRYKTDAKKQAGIVQEKERLYKLRNDYIAVLAAFEAKTLSFTTLTVSEEDVDEENDIYAGSYLCGVSVGKLSNLRNLFYYTEETENGTVNTVENMSMILFNTDALGNKENDLRYETVSFLRYLVEKYGASS